MFTSELCDLQLQCTKISCLLLPNLSGFEPAMDETNEGSKGIKTLEEHLLGPTFGQLTWDVSGRELILYPMDRIHRGRQLYPTASVL